MKITAYQFFVLIISLLLILSSCASTHFRKANHHYSNLAYTEAIKYYSKALASKDIPFAEIRLADSYNKLNMTEQAEYWYARVVQSPEAQTIHQLYYAHILNANGKFETAKTWYAIYLQQSPDDLEAKLALELLNTETIPVNAAVK